MKLFNKRQVRRTTLISVGLSLLLVSLYIPYVLKLPEVSFLIALPTSLIATFIFKRLRTVLILVALLLLGLWRGSVVNDQLAQYKQFYFKEVTVVAKVIDDPGINTDRGQTEFSIGNLKIGDQSLIGKVQVGVKEVGEISRNDLVRVTGKLRPSKGTSRQGTISMAKVTIIQNDESPVEKLRTSFFTGVLSSFPEPHGSLGLGYLVGLRANIPPDLDEELRIVGLTHIIAVSGYNLTVIVQMVRRIFGKYSAYQSVVAACALIAGFIFITGGSAPIVRAAVVCGFSLLAWYYGRTMRPSLILLLSGAITAFLNPLYVWGDPGWYLSFLAFAGVLILAPLTNSVCIPERFKENAILQLLLESVCAQLATIPYTLYLFGGFSLIAPLANVVVLPIIPIIMLLVFLVGIAGLFSSVVAQIISVIPSALLSLQLWVIQKFSSVPSAHSELSITLPVMLILFAGLVVLIGILYRKQLRNERLETMKFMKNMLQ